MFRMCCCVLWRNSPWMTSDTAQKRLAFLFSCSGCRTRASSSAPWCNVRRWGMDRGRRWVYVDMTYLEIITEVPQEPGEPGLHRGTLRMVASDRACPRLDLVFIKMRALVHWTWFVMANNFYTFKSQLGLIGGILWGMYGEGFWGGIWAQ